MIIDKRSLEQQAADWLREAMIVGKVQPGERFTETALAAEIGLSRSTIRTALQRLAGEGLIIQRPYSGWEISPLSPQDATELYSLRDCLESMAARLAAERINDAGQIALIGAMDNLRSTLHQGSRRDIAEADLNVHKTIVTISGHQRLATHCALLNQSILIYVMSTNRKMANKEELLAVHNELVEAILAQDADQAEHLAREHVRNARDVIVNSLSSTLQP